MSLIFGLTSSGLVTPVRVDANGNVQIVSTGLVNGAPQRNPILFGYSGDWTEEVKNLNPGAGANTLVGTAVPAGEIWIVQHALAYDVTSAPTKVSVYVVVNGVTLALAVDLAPVANKEVIYTHEIVLSQGDTVNAFFGGVTAGDDIYLRYHAVRVDIDQ